jgi:hypothetical protein
MRPCSEIRSALRAAALDLAAAGTVRFTWRELALRARVGAQAAADTVKNMAAAGELERVGALSVAGSRRPMTAYAPATPREGAAAALDALVRGWPRGMQ